MYPRKKSDDSNKDMHNVIWCPLKLYHIYHGQHVNYSQVQVTGQKVTPLQSKSKGINILVTTSIWFASKAIFACKKIYHLISAAWYHGTTAAPRYHFSTVPVPSPSRYFFVPQYHKYRGSSARYLSVDDTVTKTALYFDWNFNLRLVFCRSRLNFTCFTYVLYVVLFYSVYKMSDMTSLVTTSVAGVWRELFITTVLPSTAVFFHGTYRGARSVVPRNTNANPNPNRPTTPLLTLTDPLTSK